MTSLILSSWQMPAAQALGEAARQRGWRAYDLDDRPRYNPARHFVLYSALEVAMASAAQFHLALLEPPFDLLARIPWVFRQRLVEYGCAVDLPRVERRAFIKPADSLDKWFEAGVYDNGKDVRVPARVGVQSPLLFSESVEWLMEYRCFILEGKIAAWSPYLRFGKPCWKPYGRTVFGPPTLGPETPETLVEFCDRLFSHAGAPAFPPAFVMDVGWIEGRGWAVVEFNPAWCSGVLGAEPRKILPVLERACRDVSRLSEADRRWVIDTRDRR